VVLGARGVGREEGNAEWDGHELEKLESKGIEARRGCSAHMPWRRRAVGRAAFRSAWRARERASRGELERRPASK
jgi:hypothetical protein